MPTFTKSYASGHHRSDGVPGATPPPPRTAGNTRAAAHHSHDAHNGRGPLPSDTTRYGPSHHCAFAGAAPYDTPGSAAHVPAGPGPSGSGVPSAMKPQQQQPQAPQAAQQAAAPKAPRRAPFWRVGFYRQHVVLVDQKNTAVAFPVAHITPSVLAAACAATAAPFQTGGINNQGQGQGQGQGHNMATATATSTAAPLQSAAPRPTSPPFLPDYVVPQHRLSASALTATATRTSLAAADIAGNAARSAAAAGMQPSPFLASDSDGIDPTISSFASSFGSAPQLFSDAALASTMPLHTKLPTAAGAVRTSSPSSGVSPSMTATASSTTDAAKSADAAKKTYLQALVPPATTSAADARAAVGFGRLAAASIRTVSPSAPKHVVPSTAASSSSSTLDDHSRAIGSVPRNDNNGTEDADRSPSFEDETMATVESSFSLAGIAAAVSAPPPRPLMSDRTSTSPEAADPQMTDDRALLQHHPKSYSSNGSNDRGAASTGESFGSDTFSTGLMSGVGRSVGGASWTPVSAAPQSHHTGPTVELRGQRVPLDAIQFFDDDFGADGAPVEFELLSDASGTDLSVGNAVHAAAFDRYRHGAPLNAEELIFPGSTPRGGTPRPPPIPHPQSASSFEVLDSPELRVEAQRFPPVGSVGARGGAVRLDPHALHVGGPHATSYDHQGRELERTHPHHPAPLRIPRSRSWNSVVLVDASVAGTSQWSQRHTPVTASPTGPFPAPYHRTDGTAPPAGAFGQHGYDAAGMMDDDETMTTPPNTPTAAAVAAAAVAIAASQQHGSMSPVVVSVCPSDVESVSSRPLTPQSSMASIPVSTRARPPRRGSYACLRSPVSQMSISPAPPRSAQGTPVVSVTPQRRSFDVLEEYAMHGASMERQETSSATAGSSLSGWQTPGSGRSRVTHRSSSLSAPAKGLCRRCARRPSSQASLRPSSPSVHKHHSQHQQHQQQQQQPRPHPAQQRPPVQVDGRTAELVEVKAAVNSLAAGQRAQLPLGLPQERQLHRALSLSSGAGLGVVVDGPPALTGAINAAYASVRHVTRRAIGPLFHVRRGTQLRQAPSDGGVLSAYTNTSARIARHASFSECRPLRPADANPSPPRLFTATAQQAQKTTVEKAGAMAGPQTAARERAEVDQLKTLDLVQEQERADTEATTRDVDGFDVPDGKEIRDAKAEDDRLMQTALEIKEGKHRRRHRHRGSKSKIDAPSPAAGATLPADRPTEPLVNDSDCDVDASSIPNASHLTMCPSAARDARAVTGLASPDTCARCDPFCAGPEEGVGAAALPAFAATPVHGMHRPGMGLDDDETSDDEDGMASTRDPLSLSAAVLPMERSTPGSMRAPISGDAALKFLSSLGQ